MLISVAVRAGNDAILIRRTLDMLLRQKNVETEILVFEDRTTDGTAEIVAKEYPSVRLFHSDGKPYMPGRVLNRAVGEARGEIVVFNNSDAVPLDDFCLSSLIAPLSDGSVGAVFGNQQSRPDARPLVRKDHERAFGDGSVSAHWKHFFSMALSAARIEILKKYPFDETFRYSEDVEWSFRLKRAGLRIVYVPSARTEHSHNYTISQLRVRFRNEGAADFRIFGTSPSFFRTLFALGTEILRDFRYELRTGAFGEILPGILYRSVQRFSAYAGAKAMKRSLEP